MKPFKIAVAVVPLFALLMGAAAHAEMMKFKADLAASSETPPTASKGAGTLTATFDAATKALTWKVDYTGLTGPATMAHFHGPAPVGKPAPVEVPLTGSLESPISGTATLTDAQAKDLMDGMMYFNIHTAANKPGEIRGQMEKAM
jgi:hypothetical protein